jgi:catechol 2,3-dioxygenase-like lactoylglutathione lyase family enzyme
MGERFDVGGVWLERPFKIRRLGHFGFDVRDMQASLAFYEEHLGFQVSDVLDFARVHPRPEELAGLGDPVGRFMRHGSDHHSFVLFPRRVRDAMRRGSGVPADVTINQITWQVGSLSEVTLGAEWLARRGVRIARSGRDNPGSNWHTYPVDPDGHTNELYYGIEQIGWDGLSKPGALHERSFRDVPPLPQTSEQDELRQALARGVDLGAGHRHVERPGRRYDVGGVLLPRPFKIVRIGPLRLFSRDLESSLVFFRDSLGLSVTEEVRFEGARCVFLRAGTEHHSLALYPIELRERLAASPHTTCLSFGLQLASYRQLRDAVAYLKERGVRVDELPGALTPGIEHSVLVFDPDGHALQLYFQMEQVGWDGRPRPAERRAAVPLSQWPEAIDARPDTFAGEPFLGPWG